MFNTLSMEQAKQAMDENKNIYLIDVRTAEEFKKGHIRGSINVPLDMIDDLTGFVKNKSAKLFVYCQSGKRSVHACCILYRMGYTDVTNIGGIKDWPYAVVK